MPPEINNTNTWGNIAVRNKAHKLLDKAQAIDYGPVRLLRVLEKIGLIYSEFTPDLDTQTVLGAITHKEKTIYINSDEPATSRHMTLAHEIGHAVLHPDECLIDFRSTSQNHLSNEEITREREANVFAHELTLPYPEFVDIYKQFTGDVKKIAEHYLVPTKNVKTRIEFLKKQITENRIDDFFDC